MQNRRAVATGHILNVAGRESPLAFVKSGRRSPASTIFDMTDLPKIKFGTDGWRAVIAREYTFANLERVAQAYAGYLWDNTRADQRAWLSSVMIVVFYRSCLRSCC